MSYFEAKIHHIRFLPQIPLGELTALPQISELNLRGLLLREGRMEKKGKGERERKSREKERRERKDGEIGKGRKEKGERRVAPWLLGDGRPRCPVVKVQN